MSLHDPNAPTRRPIDWENPDFYDEEKLDEETRRVFDVCHGCRRCFNLCDSFPRLFDLVDESATGELDTVDSKDFKPVVDACTLCDICFVNKCPYVPPHAFDIDFPNLMLRHRAVEQKKNGTPFVQDQMVKMDRNAKLATPIAPIINWATDEKNKVTRKVMGKVVGIHPKASVPKFSGQSFVSMAAKTPLPSNNAAPCVGEKVAFYATCYGNYHKPSIAEAARRLLAHHGVEIEIVYPRCCGMPLLEQGNIAKVAEAALSISTDMAPWIDKGYKIFTLLPSCALMMKHEWPLILPDNNNVKRLAAHTVDACEYFVHLFKSKGMAEGLTTLGNNVTLHLACHSRAQNIGAKAAEMLRFIPGTTVDVIERCSGHGGSWGMMVDNFEVALKVGGPVFKQAAQKNNHFISSECPLAGDHIRQGIELSSEGDTALSFTHAHPLEIMAHAFGLMNISKNDS